jgi:hypothetical protein
MKASRNKTAMMYIALVLLSALVLFAAGLRGEEDPAGGAAARDAVEAATGDESDLRDRSTDELMKALVRQKQTKARFSDVATPDELLKLLVKKRWYEQRAFEDLEAAPERKKYTGRQSEGDLSSIRDSARAEIENIIVILGEIPVSGQKGVFAPVFIADRKNIFGTRSDFSFTWAGLKATSKFTQKNFPWRNTTLEEILIGSFLYASGTNLGFISSEFGPNTNFYTNYISEIVTLRYNFPYRIGTAFSFDSRQYFFVEKSVPEGFVMPLNHFNVFPRIDLSLSAITEKGIDQLTHGIGISTWIGYGVRSRWEQWGTGPDYEMGEEARTFTIYSFTVTGAYLVNNNHNFIIKARIKGGIDNDFLTQPRFGGTIDNAKLDVVHGFTVDSFRVGGYGLVNCMYGFNLMSRLRMSFYFDYAHVYEPGREDVVGTGYGFRILAWGGLPIWITHGIGRRLYPGMAAPEQVVMIMTAAGW